MSELDVVLAGLLAATGARSARVVDGRRGAVVAQAGTAGGEDPATLVRLAREAAPARPQDGGDLVVVTDLSVHVLHEVDAPGAFLHVRLDRHHGDVAAARRYLGSPAVHEAVLAAVVRPPAPRPPAPGRPAPGQPAPGQPAPGQPAPGQPALQPPAGWPVAPSSVAPPPGPGAPRTAAVPQIAAPQIAGPPVAGPQRTIPQRTTPQRTVPHRDVPARAVRHRAAPAPVTLSGSAAGPAAGPAPSRPPAPPPQQPAWVALAGTRPPVRHGALAVLALPPVMPGQHPADGPVGGGPREVLLPRRRSAPAPVDAGSQQPGSLERSPVLDRAWAADLRTMRRLADGLRDLD